MAHFEQEFTGDVDSFIAHLDQAIPEGSITANLEHGFDRQIGDARMVVRAYERYSAFGGNRVSLCISVLAVGEQLALSAISSGGSKAVFWKMNTLGEESFLDKAVHAVQSYSG